MPAKSKSCMSFVILALSALALTNCGGGGGTAGGGNDNEVVISLSPVTARYPNNGSNWNDYVKNDGSDYYTASDIACAGTETGGYTACLHGGEMRAVTVAGKTSCAGLTASDALGVFTWVCSAGTGTAQFFSTGLKDSKFLSDLLDFTTPAWKPNSVTVYVNGTAYGKTDSTTWWTNPIVVNNTGGSLATPGTVYAVTSSMTGTYSFDASKTALVSKPGITITGLAAGAGSYVVTADGSSTARDFLWIEGNVNATGDDVAVYLGNVRFSALRGVKANGASIGSGQTGVYLKSSSNNVLTSVSAAMNSYGIFLASSSNNALRSVTAAQNGLYGVMLDSSSNNALTSVTAASNFDSGVLLINSSNNNALTSVSASNNGYYGVYLNLSSNNNALTSVSASNNGYYGVYLRLSSNNVLSSVSAGNNIHGIYLESIANSILSSVTAANNSWGVSLFGGTNIKFTGLLKVGSNAVDNCNNPSPGPTSGLADLSCVNIGPSDATPVRGITLTSSFVGKITTNDTANASDTNGTSSYGNITDWTGFQNPFRGWGRDGSAFPNADNRGQCMTGNTCRIWDWSLASGDTVLKNVLSLPTGTDTLTHTWSDNSTATFLRNTAELIGNGNGLCESDETCLYTPNIGAYQGHGNLVSAGTITTGGTITNVTLMKYEVN